MKSMNDTTPGQWNLSLSLEQAYALLALVSHQDNCVFERLIEAGVFKSHEEVVKPFKDLQLQDRVGLVRREQIIEAVVGKELPRR